jgi:RNA-splicing ligase RtcB
VFVILGRGALRFDKLDTFIKKNVPSGLAVRPFLHENLNKIVEFSTSTESTKSTDCKNGSLFKKSIRDLCAKQKQWPERAFVSLGTLGGGNHFIEIDKDEEQNRWLIIHSGS